MTDNEMHPACATGDGWPAGLVDRIAACDQQLLAAIRRHLDLAAGLGQILGDSTEPWREAMAQGSGYPGHPGHYGYSSHSGYLGHYGDPVPSADSDSADSESGYSESGYSDVGYSEAGYSDSGYPGSPRNPGNPVRGDGSDTGRSRMLRSGPSLGEVSTRITSLRFSLLGLGGTGGLGRTGQGWTGQGWTGQGRTGQGRTGQGGRGTPRPC